MDERELRPPPPAPVVAVLAGGLGRRMGAAKAAVELAGRPLISYPLRAAAEAGLPALVVAKSDSELPPLQALVVREPDSPRHPLCGVLAALRHVGAGKGELWPCDGERDGRERGVGDGRAVLAVACDMPFLGARLLAWMAAMGEVAVAT
ncbi:MAG TPA: NTP transferase domain-containing protein, partial [Solirubrobacteraceae bacterium]|nr:NTP transferase domain-containing protein [Solirubrobacteraceae bacterium]